MRTLLAAVLLLAASEAANAQQAQWLWWGTNPTTTGPVSAANPLPVTATGGLTVMKTDASNAVLPDARTNLGLGTGSSPQFTGLTLSGLTAGSIPFAGTAGLISQDNANLGWSSTDHIFRLGPNIAGTGFGGTGAVATQSYTNLTPPALILGFTQHITGLGNNTDFLGVGGIDTTVFDDASIAAGTKGVLYGHSITLKPLLSRTNSPADDATGLAIQNGSTNNSRATDALYVGHTAGFTAGALEWQCILCTGANANFGVRIGGTIAFYPFDASQATITKSAFYAANNVPTLGASNAAGNADVEIARVDASNLVSLAKSGTAIIDSSGNELQLKSSASTYGIAQLGNTTSNGETTIAFVSGLTAFGNPPTSTNGDNNVWVLGTKAGGGNQFSLFNKGSGAYMYTYTAGGGMQLGSPTGGDKGAGTLNAAGSIYVNGTAISSYAAPTLGSTVINSGATVTTIAGLTLTTPVLGVATGTSLALGGATLGSNALAVTGPTTLFPAANTTALTVSAASHTGSDATSDFSLATTLNTSGSPDVFKLAVTDTARGASTKLFNIYGGASGTTSEFAVDRTGGVTTAGGITATGLLQAGTTLGISTDALLARDGAGILAQRNGVNAQVHRIYNTYTDASNGEWGTFSWQDTSNVLTIGTKANGTGSTRNMQFVIGGVNKLDYGVTSANTWTTVGSVVLGGGLTVPNANTVAWVNGSYIFGGATTGAVTGAMRLHSSGSTETLNFGGDTASFPALKRSTATLQVRLADDSADAAFSAAGVTASGALINTGITSDATHTDSTVCQDTTSHQFYAGSGAAGICLGTSSLRFKQDIGPLAYGLADVMKLQPIHYRYKEGYGTTDRELFGFAAEQVNEVLPKLVGLDLGGRPNSVDWAGMVPVTVRAIQELQARIVALEKRISP